MNGKTITPSRTTRVYLTGDGTRVLVDLATARIEPGIAGKPQMVDGVRWIKSREAWSTNPTTYGLAGLTPEATGRENGKTVERIIAKAMATNGNGNGNGNTTKGELTIKSQAGKDDYRDRVARQTTTAAARKAQRGTFKQLGINPNQTFAYYGRAAEAGNGVLAILKVWRDGYRILNADTKAVLEPSLGRQTKVWATNPMETARKLALYDEWNAKQGTKAPATKATTKKLTLKSNTIALPAKAQDNEPADNAIEDEGDGNYVVTSKHGEWIITADDTGKAFHIEGPNHHLGDVWMTGTIEDVANYCLGTARDRAAYDAPVPQN